VTRRRTIALVAAAALVAAGTGVGIAQGVGGDDEGEGVVRGPGADQAVAAARAAVPGGVVNAVERDSEKGATWEVEMTRPDGSVVDVRLGADYTLVAIDGDSEAHDSGD
jgi:hypothetical protein